MTRNVRWRTDPDLWEKLKPLARQMRTLATEAEESLWLQIRGQRLNRFRFRRQHALERFVVDFYCASARLVVEVDGPVHQYNQAEDEIRDQYLQSLGLRVLRFTNEEVLQNTQSVIGEIAGALSQLPSPPAERDRG